MNEADFITWVRRRWYLSELNKPVRMRLDRDPLYLSGCLMGEAAEVWDVYKKPHRAMRSGTAEERDKVILELGDAYHYLTRLADHEGVTMDEIRARNVRKLEERDGAERSGERPDSIGSWVDWPAVSRYAAAVYPEKKTPPPARGPSDGRRRRNRS